MRFPLRLVLCNISEAEVNIAHPSAVFRIAAAGRRLFESKEKQMGIFDAIRSQFIEVIEWLDDSGNTILYRFPVQGQEIKNGAQLTVRESQAAVFVYQGQIADVFGPGRYSIDGGNTPILTKLGAWKFGFN